MKFESLEWYCCWPATSIAPILRSESTDAVSGVQSGGQ